MFSINDVVYIPDTCSVQSMIYYGEHRNEQISCPCSWRHEKAIVTRIRGNFVYVSDMINSTRRTVFYHKDLNLVQKAGIEE